MVWVDLEGEDKKYTTKVVWAKQAQNYKEISLAKDLYSTLLKTKDRKLSYPYGAMELFQEIKRWEDEDQLECIKCNDCDHLCDV